MSEKLKNNDFLKEFLEFLQKFGVIGLAIGVVMGTAVNELVTNLVSNIISPFISLVLNFALRGVQLETIVFYGFGVGSFVNALIKFILIAFVVYVTVKFVISNFMTEAEHTAVKTK
jgi:large conductance mechanosensitive channel